MGGSFTLECDDFQFCQGCVYSRTVPNYPYDPNDPMEQNVPRFLCSCGQTCVGARRFFGRNYLMVMVENYTRVWTETMFSATRFLNTNDEMTVRFFRGTR